MPPRVELCDRLQQKVGVKISRATTQENHPKAESNPQKKTTQAA